MKYCQTCGAQLLDDSVVCSYCGAQCAASPNVAGNSSAPYQQNPYQQNPYQQNPYQQNPYQQSNPYQQYPFQPYIEPETSTIATCALVFAFLIPIVGFICGIIGACKYKTPSYKTRSIVAIVVSIVVWIISFIFMLGSI